MLGPDDTHVAWNFGDEDVTTVSVFVAVPELAQFSIVPLAGGDNILSIIEAERDYFADGWKSFAAQGMVYYVHGNLPADEMFKAEFQGPNAFMVVNPNPVPLNSGGDQSSELPPVDAGDVVVKEESDSFVDKYALPVGSFAAGFLTKTLLSRER